MPEIIGTAEFAPGYRKGTPALLQPAPFHLWQAHTADGLLAHYSTDASVLASNVPSSIYLIQPPRGGVLGGGVGAPTGSYIRQLG